MENEKREIESKLPSGSVGVGQWLETRVKIENLFKMNRTKGVFA